MKIGIISDSDCLIPLAYTLAAQKLQVYLYYSPSEDEFTNQKVRAFAKQAAVSLAEEKNKDHDLYQWLLKGAFNACFVIGYKYLIRLNRLGNCSTQLFNIHFGPLPSFRGPVPVFWQLKQGPEKIGLSIHRLTEKFDDGPVVWMKETENRSYYNCRLVNQLFSQMCIEGAFYVLTCLKGGIPLANIDRSRITPAYHRRPVLNDVLVNWQQMGAAEICNLVRAGNPWNKGAITSFNGQEVKLMDATIISARQSEPVTAGSIVQDEHVLHIGCQDGNILNVNMLFYQECFVPTYQCRQLGLTKNSRLGS